MPMVWGSNPPIDPRFPEARPPVLILLDPDAGPEQRAAVRAQLQRLDVATDEVDLDGRAGLVVRGGTTRPADSLARIPHVAQVVPLGEAPTRVRATRAGGPRTVALGPARFGGGQASLSAGPCTVEDAGALREIARAVRAAGATALRGGVFKVRTSPHSFQGGGRAALDELAAVARETGLPFFTELTDPRQVEQVGALVDGVQIGSRHMQNFPLLVEVARLGKPILLKRHMAASADEWLDAAEYVLSEGNEQVVLCERGVKSSHRHVRNMLDVGVVPWLKQRIGLPVVVDPSHAAGDHRLVPGLARAAIAAGADGLLVEVHPCPETTSCDARQALPPEVFAQLAADVRQLLAMDGRTLCEPGPAASTDGSREAPEAAGPVVVFLGTSLTAGYHYSRLDDFGAQRTWDFSHHDWFVGLRFLF